MSYIPEMAGFGHNLSPPSASGQPLPARGRASRESHRWSPARWRSAVGSIGGDEQRAVQHKSTGTPRPLSLHMVWRASRDNVVTAFGEDGRMASKKARQPTTELSVHQAIESNFSA